MRQIEICQVDLARRDMNWTALQSACPEWQQSGREKLSNVTYILYDLVRLGTIRHDLYDLYGNSQNPEFSSRDSAKLGSHINWEPLRDTSNWFFVQVSGRARMCQLSESEWSAVKNEMPNSEVDCTPLFKLLFRRREHGSRWLRAQNIFGFKLRPRLMIALIIVEAQKRRLNAVKMLLEEFFELRN